jgi:hypothetical protein
MVLLEEQHTVAGNPDRFATGPISMVADNQWRDGLSKTKRAFVTAATLPYLYSFGYPRALDWRALWSSRSRPRACRGDDISRRSAVSGAPAAPRPIWGKRRLTGSASPNHRLRLAAVRRRLAELLNGAP